MILLWGVVLQIFTLFWLGQVLSAVAPALAERIGFLEPAGSTDPAVHAGERGDAVWDSLANWVMPLAGLLMILQSPWWPHAALVGGGMNVYTAGMVMLRRVWLRRAGIAAGGPGYERVSMILAGLWGLLAAITLGFGLAALAPG